jgi:ribosomal protein S18 acetylase RimI-like enzyme
MEPEDLRFVIAEHGVHFPDGFFARLGPRFLTAYTGTYLTSPHARAYIAEVDGEPAGYLVGVLDPAAHRGHVFSVHGRRLALRAGAALCVRPRLALHFIRTRLGRYVRKVLPGLQGRGGMTAAITRRDEAEGVTAVLSHVAVANGVRSLGLGSGLVRHFVQDAAASGCARVSLVTAAEADGAGCYYERLGWEYVGETCTPEGRSFAIYDYAFTRGPAQ